MSVSNVACSAEPAPPSEALTALDFVASAGLRGGKRASRVWAQSECAGFDHLSHVTSVVL